MNRRQFIGAGVAGAVAGTPVEAAESKPVVQEKKPYWPERRLDLPMILGLHDYEMARWLPNDKVEKSVSLSYKDGVFEQGHVTFTGRAVINPDVPHEHCESLCNSSAYEEMTGVVLFMYSLLFDKFGRHIVQYNSPFAYTVKLLPETQTRRFFSAPPLCWTKFPKLTNEEIRKRLGQFITTPIPEAIV